MQDAMAHRLLSASPDALWLVGIDGSTLYANQRLERLIGHSYEELVALGTASALVVSRPEDLAAHHDHLAELRAHHPGRQNDEVVAQRPDGTQLWLMVSWAPYYGEDGALVGYLHRLTEYTERHEVLNRLSRREAELASAQTIARLGSWSYDVPTDRTTWSAELYRIYDLDPATFEPNYERFLSRSHPEDRATVRGIIEDCMAEGTTYSYEGRILTPSGEQRWVRSIGMVERDAAGAPATLHGTCQDITDLHRAADEAEAARERLTVFGRIAEAANRSQNLDDALNRTNAVLSNVADWRTVSVWSRPDPRADPELVYDLTTSEDPPLDHRAVVALASWATGELGVDPCPEPGYLMVWLPVRLNETTIRLIQLKGRVAEIDGGIRSLLEQVIATLSRVAEREQTAFELAAARDAAMAASAHKSAFLATMSHEIRTPMNGVIGLNDLLLRTELDLHQRRLAEGLQGAGLTLLALINDILDLSKIESGAVELEHAPFDVVQVLDETATIITPPAQEKRLELVLTCDPDVPPTVMGDRVRLGQVLTNLASNAVKFTEHGEVVVHLGLDQHAEPGRIMLRGEVRDTGIGIGADASRLFEAFMQADHSTTRSHGGTGLGLTISRRLVHDMGGSIGADQRPEGGSVFWFVVPVDPAPDHAGSAPLPQLPPSRALVVDDNERAAAAVERQLTAWGLDVTCVHSASEALDALVGAAGTDAAFDLGLIDLHMPGVDGLRLGEEVTRHRDVAGLTMILLSDDPSIRREDVTAVGFDAIVAKPVRSAELHRAVLETTSGTDEHPAHDPHPDALKVAPLALHVLVVEDNPINQLVAQGMLQGLGCVTTVATNGEEAVAALVPGHSFDLVLMDCRMPRMDGYVATTVIRAQEQGTRIPIIAMTASALDGERDRCLAAGMDDFLTKPVDSGSLTRVVARWASAKESEGGAGSGVHSGADLEPAPGATVAPALPVLDPERVEMLSALVRDGINFFERTRTSFLSRIDATLTTLRQARADGDLEQVSAVAHQLRGSALNLGLTRAGTVAAEVEHAASAHDQPSTAEALGRLEEAVSEGRRALVAVGDGAHHSES